MAISNDRLRDIATHHTPGTEEREMAAELLAARETIACIPARIVDAERNMSAIASAEWRRIGEDNIAELRTEWFGIAGGENSFPSDRSGDAMAQQRVRQWLADEVALRAQIGDENDRLRAELAEAKAQIAARQEPSDAEIANWERRTVDLLQSSGIRVRATLIREDGTPTGEELDSPPLAYVLMIREAVALMRRARPDDGELVRVVSDLRETLRKLRNAAWNKNRSPICDKEIEQQFRGYGLNDAVGECDKLLAALAARKGAK